MDSSDSIRWKRTFECCLLRDKTTPIIADNPESIEIKDSTLNLERTENEKIYGTFLFDCPADEKYMHNIVLSGEQKFKEHQIALFISGITVHDLKWCKLDPINPAPRQRWIVISNIKTSWDIRNMPAPLTNDDIHHIKTNYEKMQKLDKEYNLKYPEINRLLRGTIKSLVDEFDDEEHFLNKWAVFNRILRYNNCDRECLRESIEKLAKIFPKYDESIQCYEKYLADISLFNKELAAGQNEIFYQKINKTMDAKAIQKIWKDVLTDIYEIRNPKTHENKYNKRFHISSEFFLDITETYIKCLLKYK